MKETIPVNLTKPAKRFGGDKYENSSLNFAIYIPQYISRPAGKPLTSFLVTFENPEQKED